MRLPQWTRFGRTDLILADARISRGKQACRGLPPGLLQVVRSSSDAGDTYHACLAWKTSSLSPGLVRRCDCGTPWLRGARRARRCDHRDRCDHRGALMSAVPLSDGARPSRSRRPRARRWAAGHVERLPSRQARHYALRLRLWRCGRRMLRRARDRPEDVPLAVELCDGDPVSELSQAGETATSGAAVATVV